MKGQVITMISMDRMVTITAILNGQPKFLYLKVCIKSRDLNADTVKLTMGQKNCTRGIWPPKS